MAKNLRRFMLRAKRMLQDFEVPYPPLYGLLICPIGTMTYGFLGSVNKIRGKFATDGKFRIRWIHGWSIESDPNFTEQSPRIRRNCHRGEQGEDFKGDTMRNWIPFEPLLSRIRMTLKKVIKKRMLLNSIRSLFMPRLLPSPLRL
jgi:hypothetical protein